MIAAGTKAQYDNLPFAHLKVTTTPNSWFTVNLSTVSISLPQHWHRTVSAVSINYFWHCTSCTITPHLFKFLYFSVTCQLRKIFRSKCPGHWLTYRELQSLWLCSIAHHYHVDNCPHGQPVNQDWRPMQIKINSGGGLPDPLSGAHRNQCASCVNALIQSKPTLQL